MQFTHLSFRFKQAIKISTKISLRRYRNVCRVAVPSSWPPSFVHRQSGWPSNRPHDWMVAVPVCRWPSASLFLSANRRKKNHYNGWVYKMHSCIRRTHLFFLLQFLLMQIHQRVVTFVLLFVFRRRFFLLGISLGPVHGLCVALTLGNQLVGGRSSLLCLALAITRRVRPPRAITNFGTDFRFELSGHQAHVSNFAYLWQRRHPLVACRLVGIIVIAVVQLRQFQFKRPPLQFEMRIGFWQTRRQRTHRIVVDIVLGYIGHGFIMRWQRLATAGLLQVDMAGQNRTDDTTALWYGRWWTLRRAFGRQHRSECLLWLGWFLHMRRQWWAAKECIVTVVIAWRWADRHATDWRLFVPGFLRRPFGSMIAWFFSLVFFLRLSFVAVAPSLVDGVCLCFVSRGISPGMTVHFRWCTVNVLVATVIAFTIAYNITVAWLVSISVSDMGTLTTTVVASTATPHLSSWRRLATLAPRRCLPTVTTRRRLTALTSRWRWSTVILVSILIASVIWTAIPTPGSFHTSVRVDGTIFMRAFAFSAPWMIATSILVSITTFATQRTFTVRLPFSTGASSATIIVGSRIWRVIIVGRSLSVIGTAGTALETPSVRVRRIRGVGQHDASLSVNTKISSMR